MWFIEGDGIMVNVKEKLLSNATEIPKEMDSPAKRMDSSSMKMPEFIDETQTVIIPKTKTGKMRTESERIVSSHTQADVNWATIVNKITIPNIVNGVLVLGGGYTGSLLGVGVATGLGFALGGPAGATIGYQFGNYGGFVIGVIGGNRVGKMVANELKDSNQEDIVKNGTTQFSVDVETRTNIEKEKKL